MYEYSVANFFVVLELLVGEMMFMYPYRRRRYFWIRFPLAAAACLVLGFFNPQISLPVRYLSRVIQLFIYFAATVAVYAFSFNLKFKVVLALCSAGYSLQHIIYQISTLFHNLPFGEGFTTFVNEYHRIVEVSIFIIFYIIFYFVFARCVARHRIDKDFNNLLNFLAVFVVLVCIVMSLYSRGSNVPVYVALYSIISCSLALILQFAFVNITRLNNENERIRLKTETDIAKYETIKDAVEFINIKCHDIKKELNMIERDGGNTEKLEELKNTIEIYDSVPQTGSVIIDTILLNATLRHGQQGVRFSFSGNGEWLDFVDDADLKSLFINAVSNACEAAVGAEPNRRTISVVLGNKGDMVFLTVRNYYVGEATEPGILPPTSRPDNVENHGFGLKSMRLVAKKYGGDVNVSGDGNIFTLTIFLFKGNQKQG